jgi:hypothetical protein
MSRLRKPSLTFLYSLVLLSVVLSGCGRKTSVDTSNDDATSAAQTVEAMNL